MNIRKPKEKKKQVEEKAKKKKLKILRIVFIFLEKCYCPRTLGFIVKQNSSDLEVMKKEMIIPQNL